MIAAALVEPLVIPRRASFAQGIYDIEIGYPLAMIVNGDQGFIDVRFDVSMTLSRLPYINGRAPIREREMKSGPGKIVGELSFEVFSVDESPAPGVGLKT